MDPTVLAALFGGAGGVGTGAAMPAAPTLGATLEPGMMAGAGAVGDGASVMGGGAGGMGGILSTLRGVQAPAAPTPQKVGTPAQPALKPIQGGAYFDLLASLGIGPQQALPGLKLPSTLGQALGRG